MRITLSDLGLQFGTPAGAKALVAGLPEAPTASGGQPIVVDCAGCYAGPPFFTELLRGLTDRFPTLAVQLHNPLQAVGEQIRRVIWQLGLEARVTVKLDVPAISTNGTGKH